MRRMRGVLGWCFEYYYYYYYYYRYDWPGGRNLNIIASSPTDVLWDNERSNGSTYYYHPANQDCKRLVSLGGGGGGGGISSSSCRWDSFLACCTSLS